MAISFDLPEYTTNVDALGTLKILDAIVQTDKKIKFYQAGTSEMFGKVVETPQTEKLLSILEVHMVLQKYTLIGLQLTIESHIIYLHVMEFFLITKVH